MVLGYKKVLQGSNEKMWQFDAFGPEQIKHSCVCSQQAMLRDTGDPWAEARVTRLEFGAVQQKGCRKGSNFIGVPAVHMKCQIKALCLPGKQQISPVLMQMWAGGQRAALLPAAAGWFPAISSAPALLPSCMKCAERCNRAGNAIQV